MKAAFYDFDGTLASSNVVTRYLYFARRCPSPLESFYRTAVAVGGVPFWLLIDAWSRAAFNRQFFGLYAGLSESWLRVEAAGLFEQETRGKIYAGSRELLERDRQAGYTLILVTGGLDFAVERASTELGFDHLLANKMVFSDGVATGHLHEPLLAEQGKTDAMRHFCYEHGVDPSSLKAYSDSYSDLAMLEMAAQPTAVNPDRKLSRIAAERGWPTVVTKGK
ncbi:MAG: HAD family hydrolase [Acidobacteria bacterium]|nr:HAD family hydrolase [Acidobacteriota bacterium]MDA1236646.1 HAD family hydrolase [Acidobacteriota bacterium]